MRLSFHAMVLLSMDGYEGPSIVTLTLRFRQTEAAKSMPNEPETTFSPDQAVDRLQAFSCQGGASAT